MMLQHDAGGPHAQPPRLRRALMDTPGHPAGVAVGAQFLGRGALSASGVHVPLMHLVGVRQPPHAQHAQHAQHAHATATSVVLSRTSAQRDKGGRCNMLHRVHMGSVGDPNQVYLALAPTPRCSCTEIVHWDSARILPSDSAARVRLGPAAWFHPARLRPHPPRGWPRTATCMRSRSLPVVLCLGCHAFLGDI